MCVGGRPINSTKRANCRCNTSRKRSVVASGAFGGATCKPTLKCRAWFASLAASSPKGVFTVSENGVAPDSYNPRASKIPGLREAAERDDWECVVNGNAIESLVEQYTSMVKEKSVADKSRKDADFFNTYQSSQMIASTVAPGVKPAYEQDELDFGDWS